MPSMSDFPPAGNLPSGNSCHNKQFTSQFVVTLKSVLLCFVAKEKA